MNVVFIQTSILLWVTAVIVEAMFGMTFESHLWELMAFALAALVLSGLVVVILVIIMAYCGCFKLKKWSKPHKHRKNEQRGKTRDGMGFVGYDSSLTNRSIDYDKTEFENKETEKDLIKVEENKNNS